MRVTKYILGMILSLSVVAQAELPNHTAVQTALKKIVGNNGGLNLNMWATIVDRDGLVQVVDR